MQNIVENFKKRVNELDVALKNLGSVDTRANEKSNLFDYKTGRANYLKSSMQRSIKNLREASWSLVGLRNVSKENEKLVLEILNVAVKLNKDIPKELVQEYLNKISELSSKLNKGPSIEKATLFREVPQLPETIMPDVLADINEMRKCFEAEAYRSCIVICGRIIETALQRKYYEIAGIDLLETSPGMGLGKLIAKLREKNIRLDPGLTQQIHLINQVRIFSVHTKKEAFYPSKRQAHAVILYTLDVIKKLFV